MQKPRREVVALTSSPNNKTAHDQRAFIGKRLRDLRKSRGLSQGDIGKTLGIPQTTLSEIELGKASLTAEQLILVLKAFNVPVSHFDQSPGEVSGTIQKALVSHGASHLVDDHNLLPSESLVRVDAAIREALVAGESARELAALAPIIIGHVGQINFHRLYAQFKDYNLETRYGWLLDNVLEAIKATLENKPLRKQALALAKAANVLQDHQNRVFPNGVPTGSLHVDYLGTPVLSPKTKTEIDRNRSQVSQKWNILTTIPVEDFVKAIQEAHVPHAG